MAQSTFTRVSKDLSLMKNMFMGHGFQLLLQVTNRCNMKCGFCEFWSNPAHPREELTVVDFERLAENLALEGSYVISVEGGEPLIRPDIVDIIRVLSKKHHTVLYTNGWYATPDLAQRLFDAGLGIASVSVDFPSDHHSKVRGVEGAFDQTLHAIEYFKDASPSGGRQVHMMTVLMKENVSVFEDLLKLSRSKGIGHMITLLSQKGFRRGHTQASNMPPKEIAERLSEWKKKYPHFLAYSSYLEGVGPFLNGADMPSCRAGVSSFNVDHVGNASVCIEKIDKVAGNVRTDDWSRIRKSLRSSREPVGCQDCWTLCRGFNQIYSKPTLTNMRELSALRG